MQYPHNVMIQAAISVIKPDSILPPFSDANNLSLLKGHKHTLIVTLEEFILKKVETVLYIWNQGWVFLESLVLWMILAVCITSLS